MTHRASRVYSTEDARLIARRRLPKLIFDFVDGATGREVGTKRNVSQFDHIMLQPRVMTDVAQYSLKTELMGKFYKLPFGIAPMGMCNLVHPKADTILAHAAKAMNFPVCLSSAASTSIEEMARAAGSQAWFQLYFSASASASLAMVERARVAGFDTLILTVDVPQVSRRVRDLRNGFKVPFSITPRVFWDLATHPRWSLGTLLAGAPRPMNFTDSKGNNTFDRDASRSGADWSFMEVLRDKWQGNLVIKGLTSAEDAQRVQSLGADAIYVSNHGARQLDSVPPAIQLLPLIRDAVGPDFPLLFDSGIRNGEDVIKAVALGANFVMLGRPALFALGADGADGLHALLKCFETDITGVMAQLGVSSISQLGADALFDENAHKNKSGNKNKGSFTTSQKNLK